MGAGWKVDLDVLGTNNTFQKQVHHIAVPLQLMRPCLHVAVALHHLVNAWL